MIRIIKRITASAIWDINGNEIRLTYKKECPEEVMSKMIRDYLQIFETQSYINDNTKLCEYFQFFGGVAFVKIAMTNPDSFKNCFKYYADIFAIQWAEGEKTLHSQFIGYENVFKVMLNHNSINITYNFNHILKNITKNNDFSIITENVFCDYWSKVMIVQMEQGKSMASISRRVGEARVSRYFMSMTKDTERYLKNLANNYTCKREIVSKRDLANFIFENNGHSHFLGIDESFYKLFGDICTQELELQKTKFIAENQLEFDKDSWKLFKLDGVTLKYIFVDLSEVISPTLKQEVKAYLKFRYSYEFSTADRAPLLLIQLTNILLKLCPHIHFFSDVTIADAKTLQLHLENTQTQMQVFSKISIINTLYDFLIFHNTDNQFPKPNKNPFSCLKMVNAAKYSKNTPYIPDVVINQLEQYIHLLSPMDNTIFKILAATGMRAKEVLFLEENCLSKGRYDDLYILRYIPYKTLNARKKKGLQSYHQIYVNQEIADLINEQTKTSKALREMLNVPYIFLYKNKGRQVCLPNTGNYSVKINKLIKQHNICDKHGALWKFSTRQLRKTLVVKMIENNATVTDLVYQLGHLSHSTVMKHYAEVKTMKLAELNTEFFKKEFGLLLSKDNLVEYTEEERKLLFIDFRLSRRRVEFGFCVRKQQNNPCSYQNKTSYCASCPNLCTGKQYLSFWCQLVSSQQQVLRSLIDEYKAENIKNYQEFTQYILENRKLLAYQNIVKAIKEVDDSECHI